MLGLHPMNAIKAATVCLGLVVFDASATGSFTPQVTRPMTRASGTETLSMWISSTVVASLVAQKGNLTVLVLWRGSPKWLGSGGGMSSGGGGGSGGVMGLYFTYGGLTFDVQVDGSVARLLDRQVSLNDGNVILVDHVDTQPNIVRMMHVDPAVPSTPDATYVVLRRHKELVEFLQCDLFLTSPVVQLLRERNPDYLNGWMATHPCGA